MKNQYFGDVNDYRKYGVLRCLAADGRFTIGVCWMLTPSDGSTDGRLTRYLASPVDWRHRDPLLFDALRSSVVQREVRDIGLVHRLDLLPGAICFEAQVPPGKAARAGYFSACLEHLAPSDILFFDPDNGIEVVSVPYGSKASPKYVYWCELAAAFRAGHSLLIYQHYPRQERRSFHRKISTQFARQIQPQGQWALATSSVVYFLAAQATHLGRVEASIDDIRARWGKEVTPINLLDA